MKLNLRTCGPLSVLIGLLGCSSGQDATMMDPTSGADESTQAVAGEGDDFTIGEVEQAISYSDLTSNRGPGGIKCTSTSVIIGKVYYVHTPSDKVGFYYCAGNVSGNVKGFLKINTGAGGSGATGPTGPTGPQGAAGPQGAKGATGAQGASITGPQGVTGAQGPQGAPGSGSGTGITGPTGPQGATGAPGAAGPQGAAGAAGPQGAKGADGAPGVAGPQGAAGAAGPQGAAGAAGPQGAKGADGAQGAAGAAGPQGANGAPGVAGAAGPQGAKGADGAQGAAGAAGPQGPAGAKAFVATSAPSAPTAACPGGVVTIEVGTDLNGNGAFDRPAEVTGSAQTCNAAAACNAVCGNGVIDSCGGEVCDTNGAGPDVVPAGSQPGSTCSADCSTVVAPIGPSANCSACTNAQCGDLVAACSTEDNVAGSPIGACNAVIQCMHVSFPGPATCAVTDTAACYCGTGAGGSVDIAACLGGSSSGECKEVIRQNSGCIGSSNEAQCILSRQNDTDYGFGDASQIVNCQRSNCATECGLNP